jgi:hypothetical protein
MFSCFIQLYEKAASTNQNLPCLPKAIYMEKEMGEKLGIRKILL